MKKQQSEVRGQKSEDRNARALESRVVPVWMRSLLSGFVLAIAMVLSGSVATQLSAQQPAPQVSTSKSETQAAATATQALQSVVAKQAALVTEFDVNGLKVLVKRREGSLTVAAGLFLRGGSS